MNVSTVPTINGDQTPNYNRAHHIVISNQPHLQQQQLIQQHLQQKHHLQHQQHLIHNIKEDGSSSSRKSSASSFFAAIRPRSKSDSARRRSDKIQNQISTISDRSHYPPQTSRSRNPSRGSVKDGNGSNDSSTSSFSNKFNGSSNCSSSGTTSVLLSAANAAKNKVRQRKASRKTGVLYNNHLHPKAVAAGLTNCDVSEERRNYADNSNAATDGDALTTESDRQDSYAKRNKDESRCEDDSQHSTEDDYFDIHHRPPSPFLYHSSGIDQITNRKIDKVINLLRPRQAVVTPEYSPNSYLHSPSNNMFDHKRKTTSPKVPNDYPPHYADMKHVHYSEVGSRKDVAEPEMRRRAASLSTPHRGSDVNVDPLHSAILFRDARGLPETDPFMEKMEKDEESTNYGKDGQIFVQFFHFHKCYDLIPTSAKLVVFDTELLVKKAFFALVYNGVRAAPLWDSTKQRFVGMLTITDFIRILQMYYKSPTVEMEELEEHQLQTWRSVLKKDDVKQLVSIDPEATLFDAIKTLIQNKIHRLPVIDPETGNVLYILTHKRLLRFLFLYIHDLPKPQYFNSSINDLKIGTYNDIEIAHHSTPIIEALNKFVKRRISALPIVDEEGRLIDIYAKFDVINLAAEKTYSNLDISLKKANEHRNEWFEGVHSCKHTDTLFSVMEKIVKAEVHRLVIVDENNRVMGVVSLSDILSYLVLRPLDENGNGTESTTCDDTTKEVKISNGTNSEAALDENKDINTGSEISVTKQFVEEETVMNTAVED